MEKIQTNEMEFWGNSGEYSQKKTVEVYSFGEVFG